MITSNPSSIYVWSWLPNKTKPIPTGILESNSTPGGGELITFAYARSYLDNPAAIPIYLPELPLYQGRIQPEPGLEIAGAIRDGGPDAWGQRVIMRQLELDARTHDPGNVSVLTYLARSGSDRPGALDFQDSATDYVERRHLAPLEALLCAADAIQAGEPIENELARALTAGSSAGGARPKATFVDGNRHLLAKFSSMGDTYPVIKAEAAAMKLAKRVGLKVAEVELVKVLNRDVLLVERFDRNIDGTRNAFVSALTILGLHEMAGRHATYHELADIIRHRFTNRIEALKELFSRIVFNILVGNNDDHARNHAAFWDGVALDLTPAYDICPQARVGNEQAQAMAIAPDGSRLSQLATCLKAAEHYELSTNDARQIVDHQVDTVRTEWSHVCEEVELTQAESAAMWQRQFLNPFAFYGY